MGVELKKGDRVKLINQEQLFELFERKSFFTEDYRKEASEKLAGKEGVVKSIEDKYAFNYFFFLPDGEDHSYSIPYHAVDFKSVTSS